jgi:hypothetical protein
MAGAAEGYPTVAKAVANTKKRGDLAGAETQSLCCDNQNYVLWFDHSAGSQTWRGQIAEETGLQLEGLSR